MTDIKIYERLSSLFEKLNIDHPSASAENAELMAYSEAIDDIKNDFEKYFLMIFPDTATDEGLSLYCELLGIDSDASPQDKTALIKQRLSRLYGDYTFNEMTDQIENLSDSLSVSCDDFTLTINGGINADANLLSALGRILENYVPPCTVVKFASDGADFDFWDSTDFMFENYDESRLTFDLADTVKI